MGLYLRPGSSVMVDGHVGSLRYLIEPDMAIVEIWVNKAVSEELLVWRTQISAVSRDDQTEGGEYVEGLSPRGRGNPRLAPTHSRRCWSILAWAGQPQRSFVQGLHC